MSTLVLAACAGVVLVLLAIAWGTRRNTRRRDEEIRRLYVERSEEMRSILSQNGLEPPRKTARRTPNGMDR
jgi:hypothetical protein